MTGSHGRLLSPASLLRDCRRALGLLVSLSFLPCLDHLVVLPPFDNGEQLVELVEAAENHDGPRLPVDKVALDELVVLLPRQCLHEQEVLARNRVLYDGWPDDDVEVRVLCLHVQACFDLLGQLVFEGSEVLKRLRSSETLIKLTTSSCLWLLERACQAPVWRVDLPVATCFGRSAIGSCLRRRIERLLPRQALVSLLSCTCG